MNNQSLSGNIALVTGGSRGIGCAISKQFAQAGAHVIINYLSDQTTAENVVNEITSQGGQATAIKADIGDNAQIKNLFAQVKRQFSRIDILVNNAGMMKPQGPLDMDWDTTIQTFTVDTVGPMFCAREAMKLMMETNTSGNIINITSVRGLEHAGLGGNLAYSAAKAALANFTCSLAKEWDIKKFKIRVNAIAPGYTNTNLHDWDPDTVKRKSQETALGKILDPSEIAAAALFLASPAASGITGEILVVDAGLRLK